MLEPRLCRHLASHPTRCAWSSSLLCRWGNGGVKGLNCLPTQKGVELGFRTVRPGPGAGALNSAALPGFLCLIPACWNCCGGWGTLREHPDGFPPSPECTLPQVRSLQAHGEPFPRVHTRPSPPPHSPRFHRLPPTCPPQPPRNLGGGEGWRGAGALGPGLAPWECWPPLPWKPIPHRQ